jgi:hypothetical protein
MPKAAKTGLLESCPTDVKSAKSCDLMPKAARILAEGGVRPEIGARPGIGVRPGIRVRSEATDLQ